MEIRFCKECGRQLKYPKAKTGLCNDCRVKHLRENIQQLKDRSGEYYMKWLYGMARFWEKEFEHMQKQQNEVKYHGEQTEINNCVDETEA